MILIFGGTTEGRAAAEVLDSAGKPYYYSTRGEMQQVACAHGIRVTGGMEAEAMEAFCRKHRICLLIDAAHPFAERLHANIAQVAGLLKLPVIRYERTYPPRDPACIWCDTYEEAVSWLEAHQIKKLLALSGVQTITPLKAYWRRHMCWFRVLNRPESVRKAAEQGFPVEQLVFFEENIPETFWLDSLQPEAILTKESGDSGFFTEKVRAALERRLPVVVVKRPLLPPGFDTVTGKYGLRHEVERLLPGFFPLNSGYTTGSCACAAAKAALITLLTEEEQKRVAIALPNGETVELPVFRTCRERQRVTCSVIKDAGDDPDVTNGKEIRVTVSFCPMPGVYFQAGEGVGRVTLPGLGLEVGEPAINPVPRQMIRGEIEKLLAVYKEDQGVVVEIAVPGGKELALKTFNPKLGIVGGISIIGTSGVVRPFSVEAFIQTIRKEIQVAKALGCTHIVINSGAKSEGLLRERFPDLLPQAFIHYGNYIGDTLKIASTEGIQQITMGIMIGKAVKLAEGNPDTHSRQVEMNRDFIAGLASEAGCPAAVCQSIREVPLARELWKILPDNHLFFILLCRKCKEVCRTFFPSGDLDILLLHE